MLHLDYRRAGAFGLLIALAPGLCGAARGQSFEQSHQPIQPAVPTPPGATSPSNIFLGQQPIEQGIEDRGPLSASQRDTAVDLRLPLGFQQVYRVPGQENLLMRASGALYAAFPFSTYAQTENGLRPIVPPGTVFHIGLPADWGVPGPGEVATPDAVFIDDSAARLGSMAPDTAARTEEPAARLGGRIHVPYQPLPSMMSMAGDTAAQRMPMTPELLATLRPSVLMHASPGVDPAAMLDDRLATALINSGLRNEPAAAFRERNALAADTPSAAATSAATAPTPAATIINDPEYRARRIGELLAQAARGQG